MTAPRWIDLSGRIAIVTGGSQGIGLAIAEALAGAGATVAVVNRREETGQLAATKIRAAGGSAIAVPADVRQAAAVERMAAEVLRQLGQIDILVNNAGVIARKPAVGTSDAELAAMVETNLHGVFLCCRAVAPHMTSRRRGTIINTSSVSATLGMDIRAVYCATKGGVSSLTRALAVEWARHNIRVNAIAPGIIQTPILADYLRQEPERVRKACEEIPMGRLGRPEDLAGVALFLASDASEYVTGQTIFVDGGWTAGSTWW